MAEFEWDGVSIPESGGFYDFLDTVKDSSDATFGVINSALTVAQTALGFAQSLLAGVDLPLTIVLKEVIKIIEDYKRDLNNAGAYFTYDKEIVRLLDDPYKLSGGYAAMESRMIGKLSNPIDPTRPVFSDQAVVLSYLFHVGADPSSAMRVFKTIKQIVDLFSSNPVSAELPPPAGVGVTFYENFLGSELELSPTEVSRDNTPDGLKVKWTLPRPKTPNSLFPSFAVPPEGFYVVVSTRPRPLPLFVVKQKGGSTSTGAGGVVFTEVKGLNSDLAHLIEGSFNFPSAFDLRFDAEAPQAYFKSTKHIFLSMEKAKEETKVFRFDPNAFADFFLGLEYELTIPEADLPKAFYPSHRGGATTAITEYYVSVYACTSEPPENTVPVYKIEGAYDTFNRKALGQGELSRASRRVKILSPSRANPDFTSALKEAFALFVLSRCDLPDLAETTRSAPEGSLISKVRGPTLLAPNPFPAHQRAAILKLMGVEGDKLTLPKNIFRFKQTVGELVEKGVYSTLQNAPPQSVIQSKADVIEDLLEDDPISILLEDTKVYGRLQPNAQNVGFSEEPKGTLRFVGDYQEYVATNLSDKGYTTDFPVLFESAFDGNDALEEALNTSDTSITLFGRSDVVKTVRESRNESLFLAASLLGSIPERAFNTKGEWETFKFFDQIPNFNEFMDTVTDFFKDLLTATDNILKSIIKYIEILNKRIAEIQRIIALIKRAIDAILSFRLPAGVDVLTMVSNGTQGVISDLQASQNKPQAEGVSAGVMMVIGGVPQVVIDIITAILGKPKSPNSLLQRIEDNLDN